MTRTSERVAIAGRRNPLRERLCETLRTQGREPVVLADADVALTSLRGAGTTAIEHAVDSLFSSHGMLDAAILFMAGPGHEMPAAPEAGADEVLWRSVVEEDLGLAFALTKAFGRGMTRARCGKIVLLSGVSGRLAREPSVAVHTLAAALPMFIRAAALELAYYGITVNGLLLGLMSGDEPAADLGRSVVSHTPLRRLGDPDDVLGTLGFLLSPGSNHITGQVLRLDGGFSC